MYENSTEAKEKYNLTQATRQQVKSLIEELCNTYGIKEVGKAYFLSLCILEYSFVIIYIKYCILFNNTKVKCPTQALI